MKMIDNVLIIQNSFISEEVQNFLDGQERFLKRPVILERKTEDRGTYYETGKIEDDILENLELWSEFDDFEDALKETKTWLSDLEKARRAAMGTA